MMSLASFAATNVAAFSTRQQRPARAQRTQRCYAMATEEEKKLTFEANKRAALGFTESDSAGQTNIFAVEPKSYVAGTRADATSEAGASTTGAAAVAGSFAVGLVVAGLLLVKDSATVDVGPTGDFETLSAYKTQFAAELASAAPAAAPAVADE